MANAVKPIANGLASFLETAKKQVAGSSGSGAKPKVSPWQETMEKTASKANHPLAIPEDLLKTFRGELGKEMPESISRQIFGRKQPIKGEVDLRPKIQEYQERTTTTERITVIRQNIEKVRQETSTVEIQETQQLIAQLHQEVSKVKDIRQEGLANLTLNNFIKEVNRTLKTLLFRVIFTIKQLLQSKEQANVWSQTSKRKIERGAQIVTSKTNRHRAGETNVLNMLQG